MPMTTTEFPDDLPPRRDSGDRGRVPPRPPPIPRFGGGPEFGKVVAAVIVGAIILYGGYFWLIRRVVVGPNEVLVLLKKDGSRSLPGDQIILPRPPDVKDAAAYDAWQKQYGDVNGILEQIYPA